MKYFFGCLMAFLVAGCVTNQKIERTQLTMLSDGVLDPSQIGLIIENADLHFEIYPQRQSISGKATLTFQSAVEREIVGINLDSLFAIDRIAVDGVEISNSDYANPLGLLTIQLPQGTASTFTVEISYSGQPRVALKAPWDGGFVWSKTPSGEDWIATAVQGEGCDLFWPCIDFPVGEPMNLSMHVTVPRHLYAAVNGTLIDITEQNDTKTYHWKSLAQTNTYGVAINIAPYQVIETTYNSRFGNDIPVFFYHLEQSTEQAKALTQELLEITAFFEKYVGPYPFSQDKIGVVETPHLGMEHQTINAYGNQFKPDKFGFDWLLHHEFAHEWFANQMTNKNADGMWLHEGFGAYMQPLYAQHLHGQAAYMAYMYDFRLKIQNQFPIVSNTAKSVEHVYQEEYGGPASDIYAKAAWVLHTLRYLIGDEAFFSATTDLVYGTDNPKVGQITPVLADTQDFLKAVNKASKQDLSWFFDVYFYQAELPELVQEKTETSLKLSWNIQNSKPFPMPIEISINGKVTSLDLSEPIILDLKKDDIVIVDPNSKVLRDRPYIPQYQNFLKESL